MGNVEVRKGGQMNNNEQEVGFSTIGMIKNHFRWIFALMFWFTVIGAAIGGVVIGYSHPYADASTIITGGVIGLVAGFLIAVWAGGLVATLLNMDENLQYLADKEKAKG